MAYLKGIRRHLGLALSLGLLCAGLAAVTTWYVLPMSKYTAQSLLQIASAPQRILSSGQANNDRGEFVLYKQTQEVLLKSRFVLQAALRNPKVGQLPSVREQIDPVEWLGRKLTITFTGEILQVSLKGNDPVEITDLVNAVTDAYLREVVNADRNRRRARHAQLKDVYAKYIDGLKGKRDALRAIAVLAGGNDKQTLAFKHQIAMEHHARAEQEHAQIKSELRKALGQLQILDARAQAPIQRTVSNEELKRTVDADPAVQQHLAEIKRLYGVKNEYEAKVKKGSDPAVMKVRQRIKAAEKALATARDEIRQDVLRQLHETATGGEEREQLIQSINIQKQHEKTVAEEVAKLEEVINNIGQKNLDLQSMKEEIELTELAADQVGKEVETLAVEINAPERVTLVEHAEVPRVVNVTKQIAATGLAGIGSFALVLFTIAFWEARVQRVDSADELVKGLGMDLVGVLPALPPSNSRQLAVGSKGQAQQQIWSSILLESVDAMRARILHVSRTESLRVLMVASALKGEGKTSLACHLATSLARARRRTLLIDCDLRSPAAHRMFDLLSGPGVCEILRGEVSVADAIQPTIASGPSVIPGGRCDMLAIQSLSQGNLDAIFEEVKDQYDYVIVDSAPVLPVADSLQVCQHVDAVIFSVLRDVSRLPKVNAAYERLAILGVRMLGAVVAGTRCEDYVASYSYNMQQPQSSTEASA
jgi:capsular exopolysaccharide synthesis family protein